MKILYITTIGGTMTFFKSLIKELIDEGTTVDIATNETESRVPDCYREWGCKVYPISTSRSPFSTGNIKAIKQIRNLAKEYDIVHCHTPLAAMAARIACKSLRKTGLKVIYTAHGFHFYKGAPLKNWLVYYPIEWICAHWTDVLITINKEDYALAQKHMHAKRVEYVPGVGIDIKAFSDSSIVPASRLEFGFNEDDFVLISVGELSKRKNHKVVIDALAQINNPKIKYLIVGEGPLRDFLQERIYINNLDGKVVLAGHRSDIKNLLHMADSFIFPSLQEGLPVALMEAMASGMSVVASRIRGNIDLLPKDFLFNQYDVIACKNAILENLNTIKQRKSMCLIGINNFDVNSVNKIMLALYHNR